LDVFGGGGVVGGGVVGAAVVGGGVVGGGVVGGGVVGGGVVGGGVVGGGVVGVRMPSDWDAVASFGIARIAATKIRVATTRMGINFFDTVVPPVD
jgi:hypothetical protein